MKSRPYFPLLAKVIGWLILHLVVLAVAFIGFVYWQLGLGLDSLLSGSAGQHLQSFGESAREKILNLPRSEWASVSPPTRLPDHFAQPSPALIAAPAVKSSGYAPKAVAPSAFPEHINLAPLERIVEPFSSP